MYNTAAILNDGVTCLVEKLGVIETEIFISQIIREPFNYTEWQRKHYENFSIAELNAQAVEFSKNNPAT